MDQFALSLRTSTPLKHVERQDTIFTRKFRPCAAHRLENAVTQLCPAAPPPPPPSQSDGGAEASEAQLFTHASCTVSNAPQVAAIQAVHGSVGCIIRNESGNSLAFPTAVLSPIKRASGVRLEQPASACTMHRATESKPVSCSIIITGTFEYYSPLSKVKSLCRACVARGTRGGLRAAGGKLSFADGFLFRG
jgi:hypothetical protein